MTYKVTITQKSGNWNTITMSEDLLDYLLDLYSEGSRNVLKIESEWNDYYIKPIEISSIKVEKN